MKDFFLKLNQFRNMYVLDPQAEPVLKELIRLYLLLMETPQKLDQSTMDAVYRLLNQQPENPEYLFHYLWFKNSYARYVYFILNEKSESLKITLEILQESKALLENQQTDHDAEKKCMSLILILNILRLTTYGKDYQLANQQYLQYKKFIELEKDFSFNSYPNFVVQFMNEFGVLLQSCLGPENQSYFQEKMLSVKNKIDLGLMS